MNFNEVISRQGAMACFCKDHASKKFVAEDNFEVFTDDGTKIRYEICTKWNEDTDSLSFLNALAQGVAFLIVLFGFILRKIFIMLVGCTGENKQSSIAVGTIYTVLIV